MIYATMKKELNGKHVLLRKQNTSDFKKLVPLLDDSDIQRFTHIPDPYTLKDAKKGFEDDNKDWKEGAKYNYLIIRKKTKDIIGKIIFRINKSDHTGDLGYFIARHYRGQGHIYEASRIIMDVGFKTLKLNRIAIGCATENKKSSMIINNLGAKFEGILRSKLFVGGKVHDQAIFSIIKKEWPEAKKRIELKIKEKLETSSKRTIEPIEEDQ